MEITVNSIDNLIIKIINKSYYINVCKKLVKLWDQ